MNMQKIMAVTMVLFGLLHAELSIANIEKMVEEIKAKRTSRMKEDVNISSPFILVRQESNSTVRTFAPATAEKPVKFILGAIINDAAFIDGKWHRVGDEINGFKVMSIASDRVTLKQGERTVVLFFKKTKSILTFSKE